MSVYRRSLLLILVLAASLVAQETRGRVQGDVRDSSGALVAGASVALSNDESGVRTVRPTSDTGHYLFDFVVPGHYTVTVESAGFRAFVQKNILVEARSDITVDATLQVGASSEQITVESAPVGVEFNTSTMSHTVATQLANTLPMISRNPFLFVALDPAVVVRSTTQQEPFHFWAGSQFDVGGNTNTKNDIVFDGSPSMTTAKSSYTPPMDAVQETSLQQNAVDAEFGHSAGGVIAMVTKSGTNDIHGSAYYFGWNPALNAMANRITQTKNLTRQNTWGGTVGAPIVKNRLFTFAAYEAIRLANPYSTRIETLPTALQRTGNFSQTKNTQGNLAVIYDPWTTQTSGSTVTRQPFANNTIPTSRIDPIAAKVMSGLWQPNGPGDGVTGANNFKAQLYDIYPYWNVMDRTDYNISDKFKFFGRCNYLHTTETTSDYTNSSSAMRYFQGSVRNALSAAGDLVWTINPRTVFNIRTSYNAINDSFENPATIIGEKGLADLWPNKWYQPYMANLIQVYFPYLNVTQGGASVFSSSIANYWLQTPETWNIAAKLSRQMGRHYLKFGGEYRREIVDAARPALSQFAFDAALTANTYNSPNTALSGNGWATLLLGAVDSTSTAQTVVFQHPRSTFLGYFVHDDFKVNSRLTINLGLRAEYSGPLVDTDLRLTRRLDLTTPISELSGTNAPQMPAAVAALRTSAPTFNGAWIFTDSKHPGNWDPPSVLWEPRIGMALRVNDKTAIRAGYARYVTPATLTQGLNIIGSVFYDGFSAITTAVAALQGVPQVTLSNPFPTGLVPPAGKAYGTYTNLGNTATWYNPDFKPETNDRFNISVQRQLAGRLVADVTYFMALSRNVPHTYNVNMADPNIAYKNGNATTARVNNPFYNLLPADKMPGTLRTQSQVAVSALLTPYPQYSTLNQMMTSGAGAHYKALQIAVKRPTANGLTLTAGFNYNWEVAQAYYNDIATFAKNLTWIPAQTARARLTGAAVYDLPFGRNRKFMSSVNPFIDGVLGGWSVNALFTYNTGTPIRLGGAVVTADPSVSHPTSAKWFDTSKVAQLPAFTPRTNPVQYSDLVGPRYVNLDLTLAKQFRIAERVRFELRFEGYNALNALTPTDPVTTIANSNFGKCIDQRTGLSGRQVQFSGRFLF